jgi:hypothetical protein
VKSAGLLLPIYLDIETIPAQRKEIADYIAAMVKPPGQMKKAETIAKWEAEEKAAAVEQRLLSTSFDGAFGELIVASFAIGEQDPQTFHRRDTSVGSEQKVLMNLFEAMTAAVPHGQWLATQFIGHHITGFDLPFLYKRAVINRVGAPRWIPFGAQGWDDRVYDTNYRWAGRGERVSLDKLCLVLDVPRKGSEIGDEEIDGSQVYEFWKAGRFDDLCEYCEWDVRRHRWVHRLMEFIHA